MFVCLNVLFFCGLFYLTFWVFAGTIIICSTFTHSFTHFLSCFGGKCKCWIVCFFILVEQQPAE